MKHEDYEIDRRRKKAEYATYLQSDHWKAFREKWYTFPKNQKCNICKSTINLQIHHKRYEFRGDSVLYRETRRDVMTLCRACHQTWHSLHGNKSMVVAFWKRAQNLMKLAAFPREALASCVSRTKYLELRRKLKAKRRLERK